MALHSNQSKLISPIRPSRTTNHCQHCNKLRLKTANALALRYATDFHSTHTHTHTLHALAMLCDAIMHSLFCPFSIQQQQQSNAGRKNSKQKQDPAQYYQAMQFLLQMQCHIAMWLADGGGSVNNKN